ncbi:MAG: alpha/beta fold hydrolase [Pseudomonadota bacterium]
MNEIDPRGRAFDLPGGPEAVLLIHGFTATPAEMRPVADLLSREFGWRCLAPLLPGHGTTLEDLERCKWTDWMRSVEEALGVLSRDHERIHLAGISMGALLALELFREKPDRFMSLCFLAPPIFLRTPYQRCVARLLALPVIPLLAPPLRKTGPMHPDHVAYDSYPPRAGGEFSTGSRLARTLEKADAPPTLIAYSEADELVHPKSAFFLADRLVNSLTRVVQLERSFHILTIGMEKETLLSELRSFYREITPLNAGNVSAPV